MMLVSKQQYFQGSRSICRNPTLQKMFMMLGRAEKAGSGVDKILSGRDELGWDKPELREDVQPDYVVLTLPVGRAAETPQENPSRKWGEPHKKTPQENPIRKLTKKENNIKLILEFCMEPKSLTEIIEHLGLKDKKSFKETYISKMLEDGSLSMTEPDNPTSRNQKYVCRK